MLLQTNSYIVPKEKRTEHARLLQRFRQTLTRLGCDQFEVYERNGANWNAADNDGRFIQIMRFRDRKHQMQVQQAERTDPGAQQLIKEFCELINFPYQQQQGLFAVGFYTSVLPVTGPRDLPPALPGAQTAPQPSSTEPPHLAESEHTAESHSQQPDAQSGEFGEQIDDELDLLGLEPIDDNGEPAHRNRSARRR